MSESAPAISVETAKQKPKRPLTPEERKELGKILQNCILFKTQKSNYIADKSLAMKSIMKDFFRAPAEDDPFLDIKGWEYTWEHPVIWADDHLNSQLEELEGQKGKYFKIDKNRRVYSKVKLIRNEDGSEGVDPSTRTDISYSQIMKEIKDLLS